MSDTIMPDNNAVQTHLHKDDTLLLYKAEVELLHEATLQDLLQNRNYAVQQLLYEHNELLREHISLGGASIEYSEVDFLSPPEPTHPYMIFPHEIAEIHSIVSTHEGGVSSQRVQAEYRLNTRRWSIVSTHEGGVSSQRAQAEYRAGGVLIP
ncbi:hypothetical protein EI94DRAFT_1701842 [Lactarius quietus]|nr:hypothetical protein EI94DRAFT_1701842 [Lactarius quietus]